MKKTACIALIAFILMLCVLPGFSAAEVDIAGIGIPAVTDSGYIYFEAPSEGSNSWEEAENVFCHISSKAGDIYEWQSNPEKCEDIGKSYWRYSVKDINFDPKGEYTVIFSSNQGDRTYSLSITSACLGDIVYCEKYTNTSAAPSDDQKTISIARWKNHKDVVLPAVDADSFGHTVTIDGVDPSGGQTVWGTDAGSSYPLVENPSSATSDELTEQDLIADKSDGINLRAVTIAIVSVSAVWIIVVIIITVKLAKRNKGKK